MKTEGIEHKAPMGNLPLEFGGALLMYGPCDKMWLLQAVPDFIALQPEPSEAWSRQSEAGCLKLGALVIMAAG